MKRQFLSIGGAIVIAAMALLLGAARSAYGWDGSSADAPRHIKNRTIFSEEFPKAQLSVRKGFRFIGTQQINLYGNAEAEQYVFARPGPHKIVESFYLVQFEHFLPTNHLTYNYDATRTTQIGDLRFVYDVKSFLDLAGLIAQDQASDGAAMERLLAKKHLFLPHQTAFVRMFHLPTADHRHELMIIYGEALPRDSAVPLRKDWIQLDTESPTSAQMFLDHALQGLVVKTR